MTHYDYAATTTIGCRVNIIYYSDVSEYSSFDGDDGKPTYVPASSMLSRFSSPTMTGFRLSAAATDATSINEFRLATRSSGLLLLHEFWVTSHLIVETN